MSVINMPTELEAFAATLQDVAQDNLAAVSVLPAHIGAITGWTLNQEQTAQVDDLMRGLSLQARQLQFLAARINELAQAITKDDRTLFTMTAQAVDACRFARAVPDVGPAPHPGTTALADTAEVMLADMQEVLRERFPDESFPGN